MFKVNWKIVVPFAKHKYGQDLILAIEKKKLQSNKQCLQICHNISYFNTLFPVNAMRSRGIWSTLVQVMVCCPTAPSII